jgi:hypothetical protein
MPELSRFQGIIVTMYPEPGARHHHPHFHVRYAGQKAVYQIQPTERLAGSVPSRQEDLVLRWAEMRSRELKRNWKRLQQGKLPVPIQPLP